MLDSIKPQAGGQDDHASKSELDLKRRIFDSITNGVSIADANVEDMPLIYVNPAFEKMTGYASHEVLGKNCRFLQREETSQKGVADIREAIRERREIRRVLKNYTKEGAVFWNELYLSPIFDSDGLLTHYVGIQNDVTARFELKRQLEHMALHDGLTDLANRALIMDRLGEAISRAKRHGRLAALLYIDLDGFKGINDRYGHDGGDVLLRTVGAMLKTAVRDSDCAGRLGGDEFVLLAPDLIKEEEATLICSRLLSKLESPINLGGDEIVPRASIGLSLYPRDGSTPEELLKAADVAMYRDKKARYEKKSVAEMYEALTRLEQR